MRPAQAVRGPGATAKATTSGADPLRDVFAGKDTQATSTTIKLNILFNGVVVCVHQTRVGVESCILCGRQHPLDILEVP